MSHTEPTSQTGNCPCLIDQMPELGALGQRKENDQRKKEQEHKTKCIYSNVR